MPVWYDLVLILAFAWTGLVFGFTSPLDIERLLLEGFRRRAALALIVLLPFVSASASTWAASSVGTAGTCCTPP